MNLFEKKQELSRAKFREALRKSSPYIPGTGGKMYTKRERTEMEKKVFGKEYGSYISKQEYQRRLRLLERDKYRAKTGSEKLNIDRQIRYLKKLGGV
jgi:hypothetical protein